MTWFNIPRVLTTFALLYTLPCPAPASTLPPAIEVPVRRVFFPTTGYSDHDVIRVWIEGDLPDPCYELGETSVSRDPLGGFVLHPHASRHSSEDCDTGDLLGESPYSEEVSLGQLKAGDYRVAFNPDDESTDFRNLHVTPAPVSDPSETSLAQVKTLEIREVFLEGQPVQVLLRGTLSSSCHSISDPVSVERQGDTIVLNPTETRSCAGVSDSPGSAFQKTVTLGVLPPGEYLILVRGESGSGAQILERTFNVVRTHLTTAERAESRAARLR